MRQKEEKRKKREEEEAKNPKPQETAKPKKQKKAGQPNILTAEDKINEFMRKMHQKDAPE